MSKKEAESKGFILTGIVGCICVCLIGIFIFYMKNKSPEEEVVSKPAGDISCFNTPYIYIEETEDGLYEAYIYSSVVQWKDGDTYKKIDNTLVDSFKENYMCENKSNNIKTYLPKDLSTSFLLKCGEQQFKFQLSLDAVEGELLNYKNLYGEEKMAVCYSISDNVVIYVYPINTGFHIEYVYHNGVQASEVPKLMYNTIEVLTQNDVQEYVLLYVPGASAVHVSAPMVYVAEQDKLMYAQEWSDEAASGLATLTAKNIKATLKGEVRVEYRIQFSEESIPDTTVYENKTKNTYLSDRAVIGISPEFGQGIYYTRYRLNYFWQIESEKVVKAEYVTKILDESDEQEQIKMYAPMEQWSSTQMLWADHIDYHSQSCQYQTIENLENGWISFDMTNFIKNAASDPEWMLESCGSVLTCDSGYKVISTSDNGEFIPYLKIILEELPSSYNVRETINDSIY